MVGSRSQEKQMIHTLRETNQQHGSVRRGRTSWVGVLGDQHQMFARGLQERNYQHQPGMVGHTFNPSALKAEAGGFLSLRSACSTE